MPRLIILIRKKHRRTSYKIASNYSEESLMDIDEENETYFAYQQRNRQTSSPV